MKKKKTRQLINIRYSQAQSNKNLTGMRLKLDLYKQLDSRHEYGIPLQSMVSIRQ